MRNNERVINRMFIEERQRKIMDIINSTGSVRVVDLVKEFNTSDDTIRRDLKLLEEQGLLERTYGGAILPQQMGICPTFSERAKIKKENKNTIASHAVEFIKDNDTLFLTGSTTVAKIIPELTKYNGITVVTNSIAIASEIINTRLNVKLVMIGGVVEKSNGNAVSVDALLAIKQLKVDKVFISACSISETNGLSMTSIEEAQITKVILEAGRQVILLADSSKFGHRSFAYVGELESDYILITDSENKTEVENTFHELIKDGLNIIFC